MATKNKLRKPVTADGKEFWIGDVLYSVITDPSPEYRLCVERGIVVGFNKKGYPDVRQWKSGCGDTWDPEQCFASLDAALKVFAPYVKQYWAEPLLV